MLKLSTLFLITLSLIIFLPKVCFAVPQNSTEVDVFKQLEAAGESKGAGFDGANDPRNIVVSIIKIALGFLGTLFLVLIIYAGFLWMTAGGEEEKAGKAKKLIFNGVIGLAIILAAYSITWLAIRLALGVQDVPYAGW